MGEQNRPGRYDGGDHRPRNGAPRHLAAPSAGRPPRYDLGYGASAPDAAQGGDPGAEVPAPTGPPAPPFGGAPVGPAVPPGPPVAAGTGRSAAGSGYDLAVTPPSGEEVVRPPAPADAPAMGRPPGHRATGADWAPPLAPYPPARPGRDATHGTRPLGHGAPGAHIDDPHLDAGETDRSYGAAGLPAGPLGAGPYAGDHRHHDEDSRTGAPLRAAASAAAWRYRSSPLWVRVTADIVGASLVLLLIVGVSLVLRQDGDPQPAAAVRPTTTTVPVTTSTTAAPTTTTVPPTTTTTVPPTTTTVPPTTTTAPPVVPPPTEPPPPPPTVPPTTTTEEVQYRDCGDAWRAGALPLYEGEPGYGRHLDRDGDGEACEWGDDRHRD